MWKRTIKLTEGNKMKMASKEAKVQRGPIITEKMVLVAFGEFIIWVGNRIKSMETFKEVDDFANGTDDPSSEIFKKIEGLEEMEKKAEEQSRLIGGA